MESGTTDERAACLPAAMPECMKGSSDAARRCCYLQTWDAGHMTRLSALMLVGCRCHMVQLLGAQACMGIGISPMARQPQLLTLTSPSNALVADAMAAEMPR